MNIRLNTIGKRFNTEWIFRNLSYNFQSGYKYAITGPNGSGKSTLLQVIAGYIHHNTGSISYQQNQKEIPPEKIFNSISFSAPYLDLIEEMTLREFLIFHHQMKGLVPGLEIEQIASSVSLKASLNKQIRYFSSGMKQRVKLAQSFFSNTPLILLDEPLTNLDIEGAGVYERLIREYGNSKTLIISSNEPSEYKFCDEIIDIRDYKQNDNL